jgi:peptide/nickel transport system permease protein
VFVLRRLAGALIFVIVVSSTALLLIRLAPGDASTEMKMRVGDASVIASEQARLGLDKSPLSQLGSWLAGLARLDLGTSSRYGRPVSGLVAERAGNTAMLAGLALVIATVLGIPLGVVSGSRASGSGASGPGVSGLVIGLASVLLVACPPILFALALLYFSLETGWLSSPGSIALPLVALALPMAAIVERLQSRATAETVAMPALVAAAARGVPRSRLIWVHSLRPSLQPVLGVYGIIIATLFSGSVAVERITSWPGLGDLMLEGLLGRDVFLVAGCAMVGALLIALGNIFADVLRALVDPRVREAA